MDVLIVDDEVAILDLLAELIEDEGCHAVRATNGREALHYLQHCASLPCAILVDLIMPIMDGFTFRTQQLQDPKLAGIPTIAMTASMRLAQRNGITFTGVVGQPMRLDVLQRYCSCFAPDDGDAMPPARPKPPQRLGSGAPPP